VGNSIPPYFALLLRIASLKMDQEVELDCRYVTEDDRR
jgi:hypothetical protein